MAAVTGPGNGYPPPAPKGRRWWTWAVVGAWGVLLTGAVFWSVRNDPPTVPEQRDIGQALSSMRTATGALVEVVQDERWVLRIGDLRVTECAITPVRDGLEAERTVTLYVADGEAREALSGLAEGLPESYDAGVVATRGGTRLSFFADAGDYIGVEAEAHSSDQVLTVSVFTGCRPSTGGLDRGDPAAGAVPEMLREIGGTVRGAVVCPGGGTAATFQADGGVADPDGEPRGVPAGAEPVWSEPGGWAYRAGSESVVTTADGGRLRISVTTGCRTV
ncbi:hypothetical protein [Actinoplanes derwentensis]|uniref:Uncharacterized protein n=1 Tax=Actinoplanes derwentensis TaxID=113562 RepID=A0A1H2CZL4_9ACTN|nr:hypothetical protein [Actinoplanes derwentensis]GID86582.1 hypothetical protein Ade03nite_55060 [Actinoplanes derwentensis]SDT75739.1 hypothetical protein SAMN04489716_7398 [Actinoplanes derwentensis]